MKLEGSEGGMDCTGENMRIPGLFAPGFSGGEQKIRKKD